ncbi:ABC transport system ATP-binding/permease protein [Methylomarinovum tepidoasis]|uniref:ATP-binding protein Uup n=1 Tax=Methylomarinovum tepidoasis TaxID=2840183 RepID=A0AAU9CWQ3_9GAMM|nr:ATP-binding cassette domain-containing protein [Methylomarinovum sp. IN45]BCX88589.1 ABC transport system ATP-binding/permease protein [Methylomarinovum sp. IN45]
MTTLLTIKNVSLAYGAHPLLDRAELAIETGERIGLIGRNGEGKSTLLRLCAGQIEADDGEIWRRPGLKVALLEQTPRLDTDLSAYDVVAQGLGEIGDLLQRYHHLARQAPPDLKALEHLQHQLEAREGWQLQQKIDQALTRLGLDPDTPAASLSGGWQRRLSLARALVSEPDLLLLDEPTNHLDLDTIAWLEDELRQFPGSLLFVTHDRTFLQKLATRIVDLDRGKLTSWPGDYRTYLEKKAAALAEEERRNAEFDKKLAQEEAWIRQGIKARRTRNEGRVRALKQLRQERARRREQQGKANLKLEAAERSGKLVIEAENLTHAYGDQVIVRDFSTTLLRGDRVGLIGPNGAGKSTLLKLLLKQLEPQSGTVRHGTNLEILWFDQQRSQLDPERTVVDTVADGNDWVTVGGRRRHVMSYLADFLFTPERARQPVKSLSGGEQSRLLLARLFTRPANLLVLDEPTNDLDLETLELLEALLLDFDGTLLLVSHDRTFLDNVVTSTLVFEGDGKIGEYVGGYEDFLRQRPTPQAPPPKAEKRPEKPRPKRAKTKLSYKEQRELESLPGEIERLEAEQAALNDRIARPDFYKGDPAEVSRVLAELQSLQRTLEEKYARWDELEGLKEALQG